MLLLVTTAVGADYFETREDLFNSLGGLLSPHITAPRDIFVLDGWYPVADWEIEACARDLTNLYGQGDETSASPADLVPLYQDTFTLLPLKQVTSEFTYYEIGYYLHPYRHDHNASLILYGQSGGEWEIEKRMVSEGQSYSGYIVVPIPCDPRIHTGSDVVCVEGITPGTVLTRVRMEWKNLGNGAVRRTTMGFVDAT